MGKQQIVRTDPHRPGDITPGAYTFLTCYALGTRACPPILERTHELMKLHAKFEHPTWGFQLGKCSVCGAVFSYGDLWLHEPSQELITVGHDCAEQYGMMADRSAFLLEVKRFKEARAVEIKKARQAEKVARFVAEYPGLAEALQVEHRIIKDIKSGLERYGSLSARQVQFVFSLAKSTVAPVAVAETPVRAEEAHVPAPEGHTTFQGTVVSVKQQLTDWGYRTAVTVKVETPEGSWLAWGTCPAAIVQQVGRGSVIELTATLKRGRDDFFALMSRPSGRMVQEAA